MTDITKRKNAEEKYQRLIENTSEGFMLLDSDHVISEVNMALSRISGYQREDFIGQRAEKFYDKTTVVFISASRNHLSFEAQFRCRSGLKIPILFSRSILKDDDGGITGYMYFLMDLTELKAAQEELKRAEQRYRSMYQNALQGMFQASLSGELIRVNPSYARILGYNSPEEVLAIKEGSAKFYFNPEDRSKLIRTVKKKGILTNYELRLKRKDGKPVWMLANILLTKNHQKEALLEGILVDNTKKKKLERHLKREREKFRNLSVRDNLTGLYNTRYLYQALDNLIMESKSTGAPFSLIFMDLDNFKHVVDTYGHLNGSQTLREVAQTIKDSLTKPCFGVAYGGDEFVVVLPAYSKGQATNKALEIRAHMKQTQYLKSEGLAVSLSASFGLATFPDDTDNRTGLLALADKAMFHVKQDRKDAVGTT
jgi:diguanylate cyclase (GGDEF)-like protein/PAS domain S-box-containing protein